MTKTSTEMVTVTSLLSIRNLLPRRHLRWMHRVLMMTHHLSAFPSWCHCRSVLVLQSVPELNHRVMNWLVMNTFSLLLKRVIVPPNRKNRVQMASQEISHSSQKIQLMTMFIVYTEMSLFVSLVKSGCNVWNARNGLSMLVQGLTKSSAVSCAISVTDEK